ncbi:MAG: M23 family metallopeptidase [Proteobacteria bacterium]|nr:M23 family metallopeptidase [Pseudomonadota bacterium]
MNVILVSSRWTQSRSIYLGGRQIVLLILLLSGLIIMAAFALQSLMSVSTESAMQVAPVRFERSSIDTLAVKLGEMQARVQRLDALGGRLVRLTGMKPSEFQFDQPPAQGGPLVTLGALSAAGLSQQLDSLTYLVDDRADKLMALQTLLMQNQLSRGMLPSAMPVTEGVYTSNFGWRLDPITGQSAMHEGVDFMAEPGTAIHASAGGVVVYADTHAQYGNMVEIDHGNDIVTRYAHASRLLVKVGQVVRRGDKIAEVGRTGRSTGNHLHFEVRYKGSAQNPVRFLQAG